MFGQSYEETSFAKMPKGFYAVIMDNVVIDQSKTKGTPCLNFTFKVAGGEFDGRTIYHSLWFTETAYNMVAGQLDHLLIFKSIQPAATMEQWLQNAADLVFQLIGKKVEIEIQGHQVMDNGNEYPKTWITGFLDMPNSAIQSPQETMGQKAQPAQGGHAATQHAPMPPMGQERPQAFAPQNTPDPRRGPTPQPTQHAPMPTQQPAGRRNEIPY